MNNRVIKKYKSWNKIPWGLIQTDIFNLQYKIFKHAKQNDIGKIFTKQKYSCPVCDNKFRSTDLIELHHVLNEKGKRTGELQWVHAHCHDQIHS